MINTLETSRPRVLLLAYYCSPDRGSEYTEGWNRALQCAKHFDTWVICQGGKTEEQITAYLRTHGPVPGLNFEFLPFGSWEEPLSRARGLEWILYNLWQRRALPLARRLHERLGFDLVHQVTCIAFREPGYSWKLDAPFVWGPIAGTENYPWRFLPEAGFTNAACEFIRTVTNGFQLRFGRRVRQAARRASVLLASNSCGREQLNRFHGVSPLLMSDAGISAVADVVRRPRSGEAPLRILWSGQFVARKALSLLLKAMAEMPPDVPVQLRVLGRGRMEQRWKRLAGKLGLDDRIEWLGWLPYQEALEQYAWADVFAFTSLRDAMGNVVLEALANGLPVVCLDHHGVHDTVTERCGVKVPVENRRQVVDDLRGALVRLAGDPALLAAMSQAAPERAREFLWSRLGAQMTDVYRQVLGIDAETPAADPFQVANPAGSGIAAPRTGTSARRATTPSRSRFFDVATWTTGRMAVGLNRIFGDRQSDAFGILMYHRTTPPVASMEPPTWNVTPERMRSQLAGLLARGFEAWPLERLIAAQRDSAPVPAGAFAVTFDDGHESNYTDAWPILRELGIPATIFLATKYLDTDRPFPFDDWSAAGSAQVPNGSWRPMSTAECRELLAGGLISLGAHTHSHERFVGRGHEFRDDLEQCLAVLRERFDISNATFALPFGASSDELIEIARRSGVSCCLSTRGRRVRRGDDLFAWGRFTVEASDTAAVLAAKLSGWYTTTADASKTLARPLVAVARTARGARRLPVYGEVTSP